MAAADFDLEAARSGGWFEIAFDLGDRDGQRLEDLVAALHGHPALHEGDPGGSTMGGGCQRSGFPMAGMCCV